MSVFSIDFERLKRKTGEYMQQKEMQSWSVGNRGGTTRAIEPAYVKAQLAIRSIELKKAK